VAGVGDNEHSDKVANKLMECFEQLLDLLQEELVLEYVVEASRRCSLVGNTGTSGWCLPDLTVNGGRHAAKWQSVITTQQGSAGSLQIVFLGRRSKGQGFVMVHAKTLAMINQFDH